MNFFEEKRSYQRFQCNVPVSIKTKGEEIKATIVDFTEKGWGLLCNEPISGTIQVLIPPVPANVRWCKRINNNLYRIGAEFDNVYASEVTHFVSTQIKNYFRIGTSLTKVIQAIEGIFKNRTLEDLKLEEIFNLITRYAAEIAEAEVSALFLQKRPGYLTLVANYGSPEGTFQIGEEIPIKGPGLTKYAAKEKIRLVLKEREINEHPALDRNKNYDYLPSKRLHSLIYNPLLKPDGSLLGILKIENKLKTEGFDEVDEEIIELFSRIIIISIEVAKVIVELRALHKIDQALTSSLDLKRVLDRVLTYALRITEADWAHIRLFNERTNTLDILTGCSREFQKHPYIDCAPPSKKQGEDVSGEVFISGEAKILKDVHKVPHFQKMLQMDKERRKEDPNFDKDGRYKKYLEQVKSEMVVPLTLKEREKTKVIGTATVQSNKLNFFTEEKLSLFNKFGLHAAIAIKNAQLMDERDDMVSRFDSLFKITGALTGQFFIDDICQKVARAVIKTLDYKTCIVWVRDEVGYLIPRGWTEREPPHKFKIGDKKYAAGFVSGTGKRLIISDIKDSQYKFPLHLQNLGTFISLPLKTKDETFGVLDAFVGTVRNLPEMEIRLMEAFATQVATIIWNIETYGKIISLGKIAEAIQKADSLEIALKLILTGITAKEGLGFNRAAIFRYDRDKNILEGWLAIGYIKKEDGRKVWERIEKEGVTFDQIIHEILKNKQPEQPLEKAIKELEIRLDDENCFTQVLNSGEYLEIEGFRDVPENFLNAVKPSKFVLVPLISEEAGILTKLGIIFVDNKIDNRPLEKDKIEALKIYADFAASLIQRMRLGEIEKSLIILGHQLKDPAAIITQYAELLAEEKKELRENSYFNQIRESAWNIRQTVRKLIAMPEIQAGLKQCQKQKISIKEVLDKILNQFPFSKERIKLQLETESVINVDPDLIEMAILNIVDNGLKYSSKEVIISVKEKDKNVFISIKDFGQGIKKKEDLFKPRFKDGLSLGLWIAKYYIDLHHGKIEYKTEPEKGTEFIITLPK